MPRHPGRSEGSRGRGLLESPRSFTAPRMTMRTQMVDDIPIIIEGDEQSRLGPDRPDGGLPPAVGVQSFQVFRASRDVPELTDDRGWTYHHHVDMACWKG